MRDVIWEVKDGIVLGCGIRCRCECMRFPVQRSALKQRSECVGRGARTGKIECMGGLGRDERRMHDCPYVWVLCETVTQKGTKLTIKEWRRKHTCGV